MVKLYDRQKLIKNLDIIEVNFYTGIKKDKLKLLKASKESFDIISDLHAKVFEEVAQIGKRRLIRRFKKKLAEERAMIAHILKEQGHTLASLAVVFGCSAPRVRDMIVKAKFNLRSMERNNDLVVYEELKRAYQETDLKKLEESGHLTSKFLADQNLFGVIFMKLRAYQTLNQLEIEGIKLLCKLEDCSYDVEDLSELVDVVPVVVQQLLNYGRMKRLDKE